MFLSLVNSLLASEIEPQSSQRRLRNCFAVAIAWCVVLGGLFIAKGYAGTATEETPAKSVTWLSMSEGEAMAKQTGKPLVVLYTGTSWCFPCKQMEKDVYGTQAFLTNKKAEDFVWVRVEVPYQANTAEEKAAVALAAKAGLQGVPTLEVRRGETKSRHVGYLTGGVEGLFARINAAP